MVLTLSTMRSQIVCCEFIALALRVLAGKLNSICQDFGFNYHLLRKQNAVHANPFKKIPSRDGIFCKAIIIFQRIIAGCVKFKKFADKALPKILFTIL